MTDRDDDDHPSARRNRARGRPPLPRISSTFIRMPKDPPPGLRVSAMPLHEETLYVFTYPLPEQALASPLLASLTAAQREVIERVLAGDMPTAIAKARKTSTSTVRKHIEAAYRKLGVGSRAELAARIFGETPEDPA